MTSGFSTDHRTPKDMFRYRIRKSLRTRFSRRKTESPRHILGYSVETESTFFSINYSENPETARLETARGANSIARQFFAATLSPVSGTDPASRQAKYASIADAMASQACPSPYGLCTRVI